MGAWGQTQDKAGGAQAMSTQLIKAQVVSWSSGLGEICGGWGGLGEACSEFRVVKGDLSVSLERKDGSL